MRGAPTQNAAARAVLFAPLFFFAVFLLAPFKAAAGTGDLNERFLLPAFVLMLTSLASNRPRQAHESTRWAWTLLASGTAIVVLGFQFLYVGHAARELQKIFDVLAQAHLSSDFRDLAENEFEHLGRLAAPGPSAARLLPMHESLGYFAEYLRLDRQNCIPIFSKPTSVIASSEAYHPLLNDAKKMTQFPGSIAIFGLQTRNRAIASLMTDRYETIADTGYVLILRRKAIAGSTSPPR